MGSQAKKFEGSVHSFTTSTFNFCGCLRRKAFGGLAMAFGVRGAVAALLVMVGSVSVAAQSVQFFGAFQSYHQTIAKNAQGLVANAQGTIYLSGSHALGYVPVDVNGVPKVVDELTLNSSTSQGEVMGMAIDASGNVFRADIDSPNNPAPAVEMFTYVNPTTFNLSYIGSGWILPSSVTTDSSSNLYVLDAGVGTIFKLTLSGGIYTPTALFTDTALVNTTGLSMDSAGNFYVASGSNYGYTSLGTLTSPGVYKIINNRDGSYTLTTIGSGWVSPSATTVDAAGNVWVVDCGSGTDCGAGTINLLVLANGTYTQTEYQGIPGIRTLMINQAGKLYGFAYTDGGTNDAQIWTGGTPPHNLGKYPVGTAASPVTVTVDFMNAATAGGFNVTTQGSSTGDFQFTTGGTCTAGNAYTASQSCTVEVTFTPSAPGLRTGALVVTDSGGHVLGTNYLYGVGLAPSIAYLPGTFSTPIPSGVGLREPFGTALDQAGNLYVTDWYADTLTKFAPGSTEASVLDNNLEMPTGMTVDGAGNLWVAECGRGDIVLETLISSGTYARSVPFTSIGGCPYDVAVDGSGNVYIAVFSAGDVLKETLTNGSYVQSVVVSDLSMPMAVAVDSNSNVYVADTGNNQVLEETPSGGGYANTIVVNSTTVVGNSRLNVPAGLAIDPNGNAYISDSANARIVEATPSGGAFTQSVLLATGLTRPGGLALDAAGDLYIADQSGPAIEELNVSTAPSFAFANTVAGSTSLDSPKETTLFNYGNADLIISAITIPPTPFSSDAATHCALSSETLTANTDCTLGIDFTPTSGVPFGGTVTLTDNNLNGTNVTQGIGVSGAGLPNVTLMPASGSLPPATVGVAYSQTFTASGGSGTYTFALTGTLPDGLSLSTNGILAGTPITPWAGWEFGVTATDNSPSPGPYTSPNQNYSLKIKVPVIVLSLGPLPDGAVGIPYSQSIRVSGGSGSYSYAVTAGSLPAWLTLDASTLSGTPAVPGLIGSFTITATDTIANVMASQTYAPTIYAVASAAPVQTAETSNIGGPASTTMLTFTFNVPSAVASVNVVTQGVANMDFTDALSGTCAAAMYNAGNICTVGVAFNPQGPGTRYGAVLLEDASGNVLGTGYVSGTGTGPRITFQPGTETTVMSAAAPYNLAEPGGVAVDAAGNVYIADAGNGAVYKETLSSGSYIQSTVATIVSAIGLALDGAGNVYVTQGPSGTVYKETPSGNTYTQSLITSSMSHSSGIALDGGGNVFVVDGANSLVYELTLSGGSYNQSTIINTGLNDPIGIAVDASDNLYITDAGNQNVLKETFADGIYTATAIGSGISAATGVSVDGSGNVYISDYRAGQIFKETWSGGAYAQSVVPIGSQTHPYATAMDASGNLWIVDPFNGLVLKEDYADQPSLTFANATNVGSADTENPLTVTLVNSGNVPLNFPVPDTGTNPAIVNASFTRDSSSTCIPVVAHGIAGTLAVGASCTYAVDFTPQASGANSGTLTVFDNHLNNASAAESITLSGTGVEPVITVSPAAGTLTDGRVNLTYGQTFTASGGTGPYTFTSSGTLPAGLSLSAGGALSGTPLATGGPWAFNITATDTISGSVVSQGYTLSIAQGTATIILGGLSPTYTGSPLAATATTSPASLTVSLSYSQSGSSVAAPTSAGSYAVTATITDPNYTGTTTGTLLIGQAAATVTLAGLSQTYTGSPLPATATTSPGSLSVSLTYNGGSTIPTSAGSYTVVGTINDVNYDGTATGTMTISKATAVVTLAGLSQTYTGLPFAATATTSPTSLSFSLSYSQNGLPVAAPTGAGSYAVTAMITDPNYTGTASGTLSIGQAAATVALAGLSQTYTGSASAATAATSPAGLTVALTYNGNSTAPTAAGAYVVVGTINDTNYQGTATGTMTISQAAATVTLVGLSQTYTGSTLAATAATSPVNLTVSLTYNGSTTAPTSAGNYAVVGTIIDTNYQGAASGTMSISKAVATVTLSRLSQTYTGSALPAMAATNAPGFNVSLTYNGNSTAPTVAGSYAVVGTINDPNYMGTASGTLVIGPAATAVSVAASTNPTALMGLGTLTATVSSAAGTPPGQVSFLDGTTLLGSATVSGGVATFPTATLTTGVHSITATYIASSDFTGSSSNPLALSVVDLSLGNTGNGGAGSTGDSQTTTPGGSASYTVALAPSAGTTFPSPIILFVTGLPLGATATLGTPGWTKESPTMWTLPANQPVSNISLTFQVPTQVAASGPNHEPTSKLPLVAVGLLLLPFARKWRKAGKRINGWLCLLVIAGGITVATGATGCGSSASQPPQTYNVTVTVTAGALTHSTPLTLTVK